jgi:hypothetical protein
MIQKDKVGILFINWNNEETILPHVKKISHWETPRPIIIVDNASKTDISKELLKISPSITIIKSVENRGFSGGNNLGLLHAIDKGYDYIFLLNHDAIISEKVFTALLEIIQNYPTIGATGPCTNEGSEKFAGGRNIAWHPGTRIPYSPGGPLIQEVEYIPGMACMLRISVLEMVGVFDERYFFSGEVADLCQRIKNAGYSCIIHTGVCITHDTGHDTPMRERIHLYYSIRNRFLFIHKYESHFIILTLFWVLLAGMTAISSIVRKKPHSARSALLGARDGLMQKYGNKNIYFFDGE